ncbi:hypothetical protein HWV62_23206 [Athelia sp. TMB]|nr:hypothetical protein HWV62_23206 [Athelia sp. TMB]
MLPQGGFELHTPHEHAAKYAVAPDFAVSFSHSSRYMPPTAPAGMPCVAVVYARLIDLEGNDRGIKSLIVPLHDGKNMTPGVTSKLLPPRGGSRPVNHSLTTFNHVRLTPTALLGTDAPASPDEFFHAIHRVVVGGLTMAAVTLPALRTSAFIAGRYSLRRKTLDYKGREIPIITFQTQKIPVLTAVAQAFAMDAFLDWGIQMFTSKEVKDERVKHAIASLVKTVVVGHTLDAGYELADRCGAQGLFEVNQITGNFNDLRGAAIAEGDILVVAIRLATELLLERYAVPPSSNPTSLLARHELSLFAELQAQLRAMPSHRAPDFDTQNLPSCVPLVTAIGHRMAYDAAVSAGMDAGLLALYEVSCIKADAAWYVENTEITRVGIREMEARAVEAVFPRLEEFLEALDVEPYITAPIISEEKWSRYVNELQTFSSPDASSRSVLGPGGMLSSKL